MALQNAAAACGYAATPNEIAWYVVLTHAAVGWAWAEALDGIARYLALIIETVCWACPAAPVRCLAIRCSGMGLRRFARRERMVLTLLFAPLCGTRRDVPCWPVESLALLDAAENVNRRASANSRVNSLGLPA